MPHSTQEYITELRSSFELNRNDSIAIQQKAYLKNRFEHFGLKSPERRELSKPFLQKAFLPSKEEAFQIVETLWKDDYRDFQYFSMDLLLKYKKTFTPDDIPFFEELIINKSWWDTVDLIATNMVGQALKNHPDLQKEFSEKWLNSNNMWLQRTAILFQLKYKEDLDTDLLAQNITHMVGSKEFFINKAIGWVLREYSKTHPEWVIDFIEKTPLHSLSRKEGLKHLNK